MGERHVPAPNPLGWAPTVSLGGGHELQDHEPTVSLGGGHELQDHEQFAAGVGEDTKNLPEVFLKLCLLFWSKVTHKMQRS